MADFVLNLQVTFLEKKHPTNETGLRVRLLQEMLQYDMLSENDHLGINQVWAEFFQGEHNT